MAHDQRQHGDLPQALTFPHYLGATDMPNWTTTRLYILVEDAKVAELLDVLHGPGDWYTPMTPLLDQEFHAWRENLSSIERAGIFASWEETEAFVRALHVFPEGYRFSEADVFYVHFARGDDRAFDTTCFSLPRLLPLTQDDLRRSRMAVCRNKLGVKWPPSTAFDDEPPETRGGFGVRCSADGASILSLTISTPWNEIGGLDEILATAIGSLCIEIVIDCEDEGDTTVYAWMADCASSRIETTSFDYPDLGENGESNEVEEELDYFDSGAWRLSRLVEAFPTSRLLQALEKSLAEERRAFEQERRSRASA